VERKWDWWGPERGGLEWSGWEAIGGRICKNMVSEEFGRSSGEKVRGRKSS